MYKFLIKGVVQGVGFRPYVYNSCAELGLKGHVKNTGEGVEVVVDDKEKFEKLLENVPPLARVDSCESSEIGGEVPADFKILESSGKGFAEVPPDLFLCEDCLRELKTPGDRREGYFFITCTNCGPRFSMTEKNPYDRDTTAMKKFEMCETCAREYKDSTDRRYHAQTIACNKCGPKIRLYSGGEVTPGTEGIAKAAELLNQGEVVAVKGVGGFHLACKAGSVGRLRELTGRKDKPYAMMVKSIEDAVKIAVVGEKEKKLLLSMQRPIVLLSKKIELDGVSELDTYGIMLPYTALHYLLLDKIDGPLVMTSSNMPEHPISTKRGEQFVKHVLDHDREIVNHVDDSVIKVVGGKKLLIRRSRGYVPQSIDMKGLGCDKDVELLALGAEMNNTFCVVKNGKAIMSQFMGNTSNYETFENYKKGVKRFLEFTGCAPKVILCDMHPEYNTSIFAKELSKDLGAKLVKVQHHIAHAYSVVGESGMHMKEHAAIVCDGLGYGTDGKIWGGEVFVNGRRVGHLEEHPQLGGDSATKQPAKMLFSLLSKIMTEEGLQKRMEKWFSIDEQKVLMKQLVEDYNCPQTTSCGRILDAASVFLGFCEKRTYDGRPAMLLESRSAESYEIEPVIDTRGEFDVLMTTPLFKWLVLNSDKDPARLAATVQIYLAKGLHRLASSHAEGRQIVFSGGCAYNKIMTEYLVGKGVLVNEKVPCGDGGIAFGQAVYHLSLK